MCLNCQNRIQTDTLVISHNYKKLLNTTVTKCAILGSKYTGTRKYLAAGLQADPLRNDFSRSIPTRIYGIRPSDKWKGGKDATKEDSRERKGGRKIKGKERDKGKTKETSHPRYSLKSAPMVLVFLTSAESFNKLTGIR